MRNKRYWRERKGKKRMEKERGKLLNNGYVGNYHLVIGRKRLKCVGKRGINSRADRKWRRKIKTEVKIYFFLV